MAKKSKPKAKPKEEKKPSPFPVKFAHDRDYRITFANGQVSIFNGAAIEVNPACLQFEQVSKIHDYSNGELVWEREQPKE
jgi:hypothetical protein